jgi:hypothetical protein
MSYDVDKNKLSTEAFKRWRRNGYNIRPNKNLDFIIKDDILTKDELFIDTLTNNNLWENGPQYYAPGNL